MCIFIPNSSWDIPNERITRNGLYDLEGVTIAVLDTRIRILLWLAKISGQAFNPKVSVRGMRASYVQLNQRFGIKHLTGVETRECTIPTSDGATIHARLYRPVEAAGETLPVLLYFHGGGYVIGDVDAYDGLTRFFAREGRLAVLSVDYRLGPEQKFPTGFEDAFDSYAWLRASAVDLGIDPDRVAVGGDSAGGGLSAGIANYAESRGLPRPAFAFLIYPSVDGTARFPSRTRFTSGLPLTTETIAWFTQYSTNGLGDDGKPLLVTLDAPHPERHPPAYVLAAQYDPLVDEGYAYVQRLRTAGVTVTYDLRKSLPHAFVNLAGVVPEAKRALAAGIRATATALRAAGPTG